uniref:D-isomer specific 2-hydroxyacid dehydrogenase catalytic domain-containing protein n=1 Tax=Glossina morsitans morsitans TaxID=37546 RepID=A0A1B0FCS3_GLOMM
MLAFGINDKFENEVITRAKPQLKCIATFLVGYEHIDLEAYKKLEIRVGYTPDVLRDGTAKLTMALLLATGRRLFEASADIETRIQMSHMTALNILAALKGEKIIAEVPL